MFDKPESTIVSVGVATKPYPSWRLPGKKERKRVGIICLLKIKKKVGTGILLVISQMMATNHSVLHSTRSLMAYLINMVMSLVLVIGIELDLSFSLVMVEK